jgi:hypothetical protein
MLLFSIGGSQDPVILHADKESSRNNPIVVQAGCRLGRIPFRNHQVRVDSNTSFGSFGLWIYGSNGGHIASQCLSFLQNLILLGLT